MPNDPQPVYSTEGVKTVHPFWSQHDRGELANAINAQRRGEFIGLIVESFPSLSSYQAGEFVLCREEASGKTVTVEMPMCPASIARQRAEGSFLTTVMTTIGVPRKYIKQVLEAKK